MFLMYGTLKEFFRRHTTFFYTNNPIKATGKQYSLKTTSTMQTYTDADMEKA
jgi:hypothetical protein